MNRVNADRHYVVNERAVDRVFGRQYDNAKLKLYSALIGLSIEILDPSRHGKVMTVDVLKTFKKDLPGTRKQMFSTLREKKVYLERKGNVRKTRIEKG